MSNLAKSKIILLKKTKYSEADLIVQGLSPDGMKLSFIARGALRSKKRFGGGLLEPTHYLEVQYKKSANGDQLNILEEATMIEDFKDLRLDYDRLSLALRLLEIVGRVSQEGDNQSNSLFNLLGHSLRSLQAAKNINNFSAHFYIKLLGQQGVLESEPWMQPFLSAPMAHHNQLNDLLIEAPKLQWLETQVEQYLY
jgi:DNA repair protein RecO (recombination protein O)